MKRYLTFFGSKYYPGGGMCDFRGDFDAKNDAMDHLIAKASEDYPEPELMWRFQWGHIYDSHEGKFVWESK